MMDGEHQIMISEALNESDRLSACNKRARKVMEPQAGPFHVYAFQAAEVDADGNPEDVTLSFNLSGIRMNETAFRKLQKEITPLPTNASTSYTLPRYRWIEIFSAKSSSARAAFRASMPQTSKSRVGPIAATMRSAPIRRFTRRWKSGGQPRAEGFSRRYREHRPGQAGG